jgi:hypothetical protein
MLGFTVWKDGTEKLNMNTTYEELGPKIVKVFGPP